MGKRPIHSRITNVLSESFIAIDLLTQETLAQSADEATGTTGRLLGTRDGYDDETLQGTQEVPEATGYGIERGWARGVRASV